jgi:hypothetical protein
MPRKVPDRAAPEAAFAALDIVEALPMGSYAPQGGEAILRAMAGARIVRIGSTDEGNLEGGGLIIDYVPADSEVTRRVIFSFNELGLWVEWQGVPSTPALSRRG